MDSGAFDRLTRLFATRRSRRAALGALLGVGLTGGVLPETEAKQRRAKHRKAKRRKQHKAVGGEVVTNRCAELCRLLFPFTPRLRERCIAEAQGKASCECPSFCRALFPTQPLRQLQCLQAATEGRVDSLCLQCGADPARLCRNPDTGSIRCCPADQCNTVTGACGCTPKCDGKACGAGDECGGTCQTGSCPPCRTCDRGQCQAVPNNSVACDGSALQRIESDGNFCTLVFRDTGVCIDGACSCGRSGEGIYEASTNRCLCNPGLMATHCDPASSEPCCRVFQVCVGGQEGIQCDDVCA